MGLALLRSAGLPAEDSRQSRRPQTRWHLSPEHEVFQLLHRPHHDEPGIDELFGGQPKGLEDTVTTREMDLARSIQEVTEEIILRLGQTIRQETRKVSRLAVGCTELCSKRSPAAKGHSNRSGYSRRLAMPAVPSAPLSVSGMKPWAKREKRDKADLMQGCYLGPDLQQRPDQGLLDRHGIPADFLADSDLFATTAEDLAAEKVDRLVQRAHGIRPRALGARSIIGDARSTKNAENHEPRKSSFANLSDHLHLRFCAKSSPIISKSIPTPPICFLLRRCAKKECGR